MVRGDRVGARGGDSAVEGCPAALGSCSLVDAGIRWLDRAKEGEIRFGMGFLVSDGEDWVMIKFGEGKRPRVVQEWTDFSSLVGRSSWIGRSALSCVLCDGTR